MALVKVLVQDGKISEQALQLIHDEAMCETFGWTPEILNNLDVFHYDVFSAIISTRENLRNEEIESMKNRAHR